MIELYLCHFFQEDLGLLCGLVNVLIKMLSCGTQLENIGVKSWHMWLNMIKQKGLQQMTSVNFHWNLSEKALE